MAEKPKPKKIVSERGISDFDGVIAEPDVEVIDAEIIDADTVIEDDEVDEDWQIPASSDTERTQCLYCERPIHQEAQGDRFGLKCPGEGPLSTVKKVQKYLLMREFCEDQEKIENIDVDKMAADAQEAYRGRQRSDVTHAQLQADIDMRLNRLRPKMKLRENLPSDGPDFEIPHITVPGRVPTPRGGIGGPEKRPTKILTQKQQSAERNKKASLVLPDSLPHTVQVNEPDTVPVNQREREYDQMMFINKTNRD